MILIFKSQDGRWGYCPRVVRHWPAFSQEGQYPTQRAALEAVKRDPACTGLPVKVERGLLSGF